MVLSISGLADSLHCISVVPKACINGSILLYNGSHTAADITEGAVLVCLNNEYGSVCDANWDFADASVTCSQLGWSRHGKLYP